MKHCSASDAYTRCFDDAIQDIPRKYKCVDDALLYDTCVKDAFWHAYEFLDTCAKSGVILKPEKFRFCYREAVFVGFHLGWDHYQPTLERLAAIRDFSMPNQPTITDIRSWYGMVNQLELAFCGSRHLSKAEAGYSAIEGEALAVAWCLRKARLFLLGCPNLIVVTDHRPLVRLFRDRSLADVLNPRLFRFKEKTLQFRFMVKYLPGKHNKAADSLS